MGTSNLLAVEHRTSTPTEACTLSVDTGGGMTTMEQLFSARNLVLCQVRLQNKSRLRCLLVYFSLGNALRKIRISLRAPADVTWEKWEAFARVPMRRPTVMLAAVQASRCRAVGETGEWVLAIFDLKFEEFFRLCTSVEITSCIYDQGSLLC